jgi:hypothetical protein
MRYRHQVWWDIIEFDEISSNLMKYRSSEFDETSLIRFDEMTLMFDESLSLKSDESFLSSINHLEKTRVKQSIHKRWDDQAWSRERIHKNISAKEKIWNRISRSHLTFRNKTQNTLLISSQQVAFLEKNILNLLQKRKIVKRKTAYNRHVLEKKRNKNSQNK